MIFFAIYPLFIALVLLHLSWRPTERAQLVRHLADGLAIAIGGLAVLSLIALIPEAIDNSDSRLFVAALGAVLSAGGFLLVAGVLLDMRTARICGWLLLVLVCLYPSGFLVFLVALGLVAHVLLRREMQAETGEVMTGAE